MERTEWRKSTRSGPWTDNCVEVRVWKRGSRCHGADCCVEVSGYEEMIQVRDTKNLNQEPLSFTLAEWEAFIGGVKDGEFDL